MRPHNPADVFQDDARFEKVSIIFVLKWPMEIQCCLSTAGIRLPEMTVYVRKCIARNFGLDEAKRRSRLLFKHFAITFHIWSILSLSTVQDSNFGDR